MKKPTCLILVGIGVLLLVGILVFVVPFIVNMFQEIQQMTEQKEEYIYSLIGLTQIEQKRDIFCLKSCYFGVFNPLNPPYQGDF